MISNPAIKSLSSVNSSSLEIKPPQGRGSPRVSVITIFLNAERYLDEAIQSVFAQDFQDFELLLVDDGSSDRSTAIALDYAQRLPCMVRYLGHEGHANRGMSASRNLGIRGARGGFIAFIDADDVWEPRKLSEQVAIMEAHPELGMVCGAVRYWRSWAGQADRILPTGARQDEVIPPPVASITNYPLGRAFAPCPSDLLLRGDLVRAIGGFEEHFTGPRQMYEDQAFLAKLYLEAPVYFSSKVWLNYRQHPNSCVATVTRDGRYDEVRQYFLAWFEGYLSTRAARSSAPVGRRLRRALWPYRHPRLRLFVMPCASLIGRLRRKVRLVLANALRSIFNSSEA
jgi:glycosyltransferase involved in cell wall biosynthesis